jgi:2-dehydro-3-deoxyglucarate aldolase/4-hydroxy-2-oxoheptanedioate aldolase
MEWGGRMRRASRLKQVLAEGRRAAGTMVFEFNTPGIGRLLESTDVDFVVFDMEHSGFELDQIRAVVSWARAATFTTLVRVPADDYHFLARVLDTGAQGVMIPMVGTREQAEAIMRHCSYPPRGHRGAGFGLAHDDYLLGDLDEKMTTANRENTVILMIETEQGVHNVAEIAGVPGVDILWIGHYDLSLSLGIPGQFDHPRFIEAVSTVMSVCNASGIPAGILVGDTVAGQWWIDQGFRVMCYSMDVSLLQRALIEGVTWIRSRP